MADLIQRLRVKYPDMPGTGAAKDRRIAAERAEAADLIEHLTAQVAVMGEAVLDAASAYTEEQYGMHFLSHTVDRARILARLAAAKEPS